METKEGQQLAAPPDLLSACREIRRQRLRRRDFGKATPLHHICDAPEVEPEVVSRDPRVRDTHRAGEFDNGRHFWRYFAVLHIQTFLMQGPQRSLTDSSF